jgi:hypothetical protein
MIRKAKRAGVRQMRRSVYCTNSFSICSLRRANFPIIYSVFWLDYKVATHSSAKELAARTTDLSVNTNFFAVLTDQTPDFRVWSVKALHIVKEHGRRRPGPI